MPAKANDIVPTDDLVNGSSVFVFRGSSKKPQESAGSAHGSRAGFGGARSNRARISGQIAASRKKKADANKARAAQLAKQRARVRVAKLRQSNVLAAKGESQLEVGNTDGAIVSFRESIKLNPKNAEAASGLSEALTAKGIEIAGQSDDEKGLPFLAEAVKLDPNNAAGYAKIGDIHDSNGRNAEAIANYVKALAIDSSFTAVYLPLGLAQTEAKNYVEAESYLSKAESAGVASSDARMARADIFAKQDRFPEAVAMLDLVIKADPTNAAPVYQKALILGRVGDNKSALAGFKRAVEIDPNFGPAWFEIGVGAYNIGDYLGALTAYQNAVRIDPMNYQAHANLASTYRQLERYAEANAAYKAAEPGNTTNPNHYLEWGFCLGKTNEWDKAVARLLTARSLSPTAVDNTNLGWAYYNAAKVDQRNGDEAAAKAKFELARTYLDTAVKQDPKLDAAYMNLGSTSNELGDYQGAVDALNTAMTLRPNWVMAMNQLGTGYRGMNNLTEAVSIFSRVVSLDGNNVRGLFGLGESQYASGDKKGAKKTQDRLKKVDPELANVLGNVIAGKLINAGANEIKKKIKIPGIPF
ncbi:MAG: tetratricopeptide repeat protein [Pyrinomonadaceae bacterium]